MTPRTKLQREVASLAPLLPPMTEKQREWVWRTRFEHIAHRTGTDAWCSDCGGRIKLADGELATALGLSEVECPHCGQRLKVKFSRKKKVSDKVYVTQLSTIKGWQVVRHYLAERTVKCACAWPIRSIAEAVQVWINEEGRVVYYARPLMALMGCCSDYWRFDRPMCIRVAGDYGNPYQIHGWLVPGGSVLPKLKRNGYTRRCDVMAPSKLFQLLLTDGRAETLVKQRQYAVLAHLYCRTHPGKYDAEVKAAINICTRHGYIIGDASLWFDLFDALRRFGKDTRNPRYICPENLKAEHDRWMAKVREAERAERRRRDQERIVRDRKAAEEYAKTHAKVIAVRLDNSTLHAWVLPTVEEFRKEGEAMHHCVFDNGYWKRDDTLILTVRDNKGQRLATVELNTKSWQIVQCRGVNNSVPKRDEEIRLFLTKNINKLMEAV